MLELERFQIEKEVFFVKQAKKESKMLIEADGVHRFRHNLCGYYL